jgi:glycosyltransferase involved in cell wall biosynthesis
MISIVIPTLNEESTLEPALKGLRVLSCSLDYELIVSDGASRDRTAQIAATYADKVVTHSGRTRQNIAQGRNAGARVAIGEFVAFLDADTRFADPVAFFSAALLAFSNDPKLLALTGKLRVYPDVATFADNIIYGLVNIGLRAKNGLLRIGDAAGEFQMMRKEAFDAVHGFREDLVTREDADMFLRLSRIGRTKLCKELTVFHSGRRAHRVGWPRLLWLWTINTVWVALFDRALSKEWTVVR